MKEVAITHCLSKKGSTQVNPFGPDPLVYKVGGKIFALVFVNRGGHGCINLKCDPMIAENLREQHTSVLPGYHMNKTHWNTVVLDGSLEQTDLFDMIDHSYSLVFSSLSKRLQATINKKIEAK